MERVDDGANALCSINTNRLSECIEGVNDQMDILFGAELTFFELGGSPEQA